MFHRTKVPRSASSLELSFLGTRIPGSESSRRQLLLPGTFVPGSESAEEQIVSHSWQTLKEHYDSITIHCFNFREVHHEINPVEFIMTTNYFWTTL